MSTSTQSRHKKKRPNERDLPESLKTLQESNLYSHLQLLERQIDAVLVRKRLDVQEALSKTNKSENVLRLSVGNTFLQTEEGDQICLKIRGSLLHSASNSEAQKSAFSKLVKTCVIQFGDHETVEWSKASIGAEPFQGIEVRRLGFPPSAYDCTIFITLDTNPEKFELAEKLKALLGLSVATKNVVLTRLWNYVKTEKLQDKSEYQVINCDEQLKGIFGVDKFQFNTLPELLQSQLFPPAPIEIKYRIGVDSPMTEAPFLVDVRVEMDDPLRNQMLKFILNTAGQKEYATYDAQIGQIVEKIYAHKLKKDFMESFAKNPALFLEKWISAACRDIEVILGENQVNSEYQRRSGFYKEDWTAEAIVHYLSNST